MIKSKKNANSKSKRIYIKNKMTKRRTVHKHKKKGKTHKNNTKRRMSITGGSVENVLRYKLVKLCKYGDWKTYDRITQKIINDYRRGKNDFLIYLDNYMKDTFENPKTILCLERVLTGLQEEAIPESMPHLDYILKFKQINNISLDDALSNNFNKSKLIFPV
jgi:hypothetical protein